MTSEIPVYSLLLALLTAFAAGLVGSFALMRRMSLAGDVISHLALPGLGLALLSQINPIVGGAATLLLGILLIAQLEKTSNLATDTAIGVIFTAALAVGSLVTPEHELIEALFGGFAEIHLPGFLLGLLGVIVIVAGIMSLRQKLILAIFSRDLARSAGVNVDRVNLAFLLLFGLTILLGLQFLGALLVGALIIVPAAIGRQLARTFSQFLMLSASAGVLAVGIGFLVADAFALELGPAIVTAAAALFALSLLRR